MGDFTAQVSSSIDALSKEFEIVTHNLANVSTVGYKRRCNVFSKTLQAQQTGLTKGEEGGVSSSTVFDFSQGSIVETGQPLDFALHGKGFFVIETPDGPLYTRNGVLRTNQNGQIVDFAGRIVAGDSGPIIVPSNVGYSELSVTADGTLSAGHASIGQFRLVDFGSNESKLVPVGSNCFHMPDKDVVPAAAGSVVVKQGYQEASNVKVVDELVNMILVSRMYEANMRLVTAKREASTSSMAVATG